VFLCLRLDVTDFGGYLLKAIFVDFVLLLQLCLKKLAHASRNAREALDSDLAASSGRLVASWFGCRTCSGVVKSLGRASENVAGSSACREIATARYSTSRFNTRQIHIFRVSVKAL